MEDRTPGWINKGPAAVHETVVCSRPFTRSTDAD